MKKILCAFKSLFHAQQLSVFLQGLWEEPVSVSVVLLWMLVVCCHSQYGFSLSFPFVLISSTMGSSLHWCDMSCYLCLPQLSQKCLDKRRQHVEHWHTSKRICRKLGLASKALWGGRWRIEGFLQEKLLEMVLIERSMEGVRARPSAVQKAEETCLFASDVVNADSPQTLLELHLTFTSRGERGVRKVKKGGARVRT